MKNVIVLLMTLALIGSAGAWGLADAENPYTFSGSGSLNYDMVPDIWGTWGGDAGSNGSVEVSGGQCTFTTNSYELAFCHDNALADIGNPVPGVDDIEVIIDVASVSGATGFVSMKIECYDNTDAFPNDDDGMDAIKTYDFDLGANIHYTSPGVYTFNTSNPALPNAGPIPAGTVAITPVITVSGGTAGDAAVVVLNSVWLGKAGTFSTTKATDPVPSNGKVVGSNLTTLSWTNPDPNNPSDTITVDVYILDAGELPGPLVEDPNLGPDVFDLGAIQLADNDAIDTIDLNALPASVGGGAYALTDDHYYYWAVHCTDPNSGGPVTTQGDVWYFSTGDAVPVVDAGPDEYAWISKDDSPADPLGDPNEYYITVTGTYTDDGKSAIVDANFVNLGWDIANGEAGLLKVSEVWTHNGTGGTNVPPDIVPHTAGTVTAVYKTVGNGATLETVIPGYWDLQLQVTDAAGTGQDVAYVRIDIDCGTAAANDPGDDWDAYYDVNNDCLIDTKDFLDLVSKWLDQSIKYE